MKTCIKYYYRHPEDSSEYIICKDIDGYLVEKPDGSTDAHGTGYSLNDIEEMYGLENPYNEEACEGLCNDNKS
ncbi:hypothetical protein [Xanthomarina gelatinilytica]|uniref:hypothetical protein n=1 Tax=Xanthomarina gelatinilytica TaxID=1137281 RepID=UPI003AA8479D